MSSGFPTEAPHADVRFLVSISDVIMLETTSERASSTTSGLSCCNSFKKRSRSQHLIYFCVKASAHYGQLCLGAQQSVQGQGIPPRSDAFAAWTTTNTSQHIPRGLTSFVAACTPRTYLIVPACTPRTYLIVPPVSCGVIVCLRSVKSG